jgi:hypothetical protein
MPLSKLTFWVFGVDDIADERLVTLADIRDKAEEGARCQERSSNKQGVYNSDQLTTLLLEIRDEPSKYDLFESLGEHWLVCKCSDGIVRYMNMTNTWRGAGASSAR